VTGEVLETHPVQVTEQQFLEVLKDMPCVESVDYYREGLRQPGE
jgi:hypothetical protein